MRLKTPIERLIDWLQDQIDALPEEPDRDELDTQYYWGLQDALSQAQMLNEFYG